MGIAGVRRLQGCGDHKGRRYINNDLIMKYGDREGRRYGFEIIKSGDREGRRYGINLKRITDTLITDN